MLIILAAQDILFMLASVGILVLVTAELTQLLFVYGEILVLAGIVKVTFLLVGAFFLILLTNARILFLAVGVETLFPVEDV